MSYGIIDVWAWTPGLGVPYSSSGYGETRTRTDNFTGLLTTDISAQVALAGHGINKPGTNDVVCIGVNSFVEAGSLTDLGTVDQNWRGSLLSYNVSFYQVTVKLSVNGGWMRGSHVLHFWGDSDDHRDIRRPDRQEARVTEVIYDPNDGIVRHINTTVDLGGPIRPEGPLPTAIDMARNLGHEGDLELLEVGSIDVGPRIKVDLSEQKLISEET